jgi:UDP-N-acetylglucosamine diphosphorylase / glucose-1-phosphate thymidylyltransferase / UDP-N-acetylgalactosamine diphosphorylase / glucosamine-1-phosphate N-acetyltransferase / galactosamine-1-phosphate N-acetyltransferase
MRLIVFEDTAVTKLYPITTGRPAYAVTCGGYRLVDWLRKLGASLRGIVRPHLQSIQGLDFPDLADDSSVPASPVVMVNARLVPSLGVLRHLEELVRAARPGVVYTGESIAVAILPPDAPPPPSRVQVAELDHYFSYAGFPSFDPLPGNLPLFEYPHDVIRHHLQIAGESLQYRIAEGDCRELADGVFAAGDAHLDQFVVTDTRGGPVLLENGASVGAYTFLQGPVWLGPKCRVKEHSAVKEAVVLGHTTKIGGEIEASIVEPYTNKQHYGFLGHSYLGSWVNLGAGTCNSDLKNTYGRVNMDYGGRRVETGMQFVGCMMGDYAKSAVNTGIFTGKTIGACSMVYGFVTTNVPSYVNYARLFGQVTELPPEVMVSTQRRMFDRRHVEQRPCDIQLIHDMYQLTRTERQLAGEPLSL